jgi:hypothetical protein
MRSLQRDKGLRYGLVTGIFLGLVFGVWSFLEEFGILPIWLSESILSSTIGMLLDLTGGMIAVLVLWHKTRRVDWVNSLKAAVAAGVGIVLASHLIMLSSVVIYIFQGGLASGVEALLILFITFLLGIVSYPLFSAIGTLPVIVLLWVSIRFKK